MAETPRRGLGRGLQALLADLGPAEPEAPSRAPDLRLPIDRVHPNPDQPRRTFQAEALEELTASVRQRGVIQPLLVRPDPQDPGTYQIVAGERRWRAARAAGLTDVPAILRDYDDGEVLEVAIIENVQRADLNAIDEGSAYRALMDRFGHTQEQVARALGKSRSHVANQMRLLQLPAEVQGHVAEGRLTAGHVRPLVGHPRAGDLARKILERRLSAREAERLARAPAPPAPRPRVEKDADTRAIEGELTALLGLRVRLDTRPVGDDLPGGGRLTISYRTLEELDALLARLAGT